VWSHLYNVQPPIFVYWIYLLPSTQQTIGCNGFYNDMFWLTWVIVRLCSEHFGFSTIVTYSSGGCWSVWSGGCPYTDMNEILRHISRNVTRNCLIFNITQVPHATHTHVHLRLLLVIHACGTCSTVAQHNVPEVYTLLYLAHMQLTIKFILSGSCNFGDKELCTDHNCWIMTLQIPL
jgi:hypothetical protein